MLAGTLRGSSVPQSIADLFPVTAPLIERWYAWDVFRSLPFAGILTILAVAISVCTINRAPGIWQAIAHPSVTTTHGFLRNAETSAVFAAPMPADAFASQLETALRSRSYRVLSEERNGEIHLYADRWRFSRLATFPFHLALIMILAGGIVGATWGFRENEFYIPEGSVRELGHGTGLDVRLDDFSEVYREDGTALAYRSDITVMRDGEPIESGSMTVNNPLTFGDIVFYQSGFGQAVALKIEDSAGQVLFDDALPLGPFQSKLNPDAPAARMDLLPAGVALSVVAPDENPANAPELDTLASAAGRDVLHDPTARRGESDHAADRRHSSPGRLDPARRSVADLRPGEAVLRAPGRAQPRHSVVHRGVSAAGRSRSGIPSSLRIAVRSPRSTHPLAAARALGLAW